MNDLKPFKQIKRDEYFSYKGKEWVRTRGRFAIPVSLIGTGSVGISFDLETLVQSLSCLYCPRRAAHENSIIGRSCESCLVKAKENWS